MQKLNDSIHKCESCKYFPCSLQEAVESNICDECISKCCRGVIIPLAPCEQDVFIRLKNINDRWCPYYIITDKKCSIYEIRPITCRIASCRFIREGKMPIIKR